MICLSELKFQSLVEYIAKKLPKCVCTRTKEYFNARCMSLESNRAAGQQWMCDCSV